MSQPTVFAHRGFAGAYPENTVAAARGAVDAGADAVEIDVQPTADGDVVVFHDRRLDGGAESDGLTDRTGVVWEQSTADVTAARVLGTDECVPRLEAILRAIPEDVAVNVELKNPGSDAVRPGETLTGDARTAARERWHPFVESVLAVTDGFGHEVLYSSFCAGALAAVDTLGSTPRLAVLVAPGCTDAGATLARRYGVEAVHPSLDDCEAGAAIADELDAALNVWTVREWQETRRAVRAGADGIIADYPGLTATV